MKYKAIDGISIGEEEFHATNNEYVVCHGEEAGQWYDIEDGNRVPDSERDIYIVARGLTLEEAFDQAGRHYNVAVIIPGDQVESEADEVLYPIVVVEILRAEQHWRESLSARPIPPWALRAALAELVALGVVQSTNGQGQTWLARQVGVTPRAVRRWLSGERPLNGASATAVQLVIENAL